MIFTGVTGGEIVSLLYPLFILSPFCYIIISKESLDGIASVVCRTGCLPFIPAVDRFVQSRRTGRRNAVISVCFNDRDDSLGTKGMGNVPIPGRCGCYREKIRYADGTFCSSSNRSWK